MLADEGKVEGAMVGSNVGYFVRDKDGNRDGCKVGYRDGDDIGYFVQLEVSVDVTKDGLVVGVLVFGSTIDRDGSVERKFQVAMVGTNVRYVVALVGDIVGYRDGDDVGVFVGLQIGVIIVASRGSLQWKFIADAYSAWILIY